MFRRCLVSAALLATVITIAPLRAPAASKEIQELQRDIAQLQEQMKQLQQAQDKNFAAITVLTQQALDASNRANTAVAVIQSSIQQSLKDQQEKVVAPVVGLSSRMDSMSNDFRQVTQAIGDLNSMVSQLKSQLTDISNAVKVMQQPAVQPPGSGGSTPSGLGGAPPQTSVTVPQMSSNDLFLAAKSDHQGGNLDIALQEYGDYLKYYPTTENAPLAQYAIAQIHYSKGDFETAANEFDMVLEKYPENSRTRDAMYYKGLCLVKGGKRTQGKDEFVEVINRYPHTDVAEKACSQIVALGLRCPTPSAAAPAKTGGKKKRG
jgi:TolA-binding protein